MRHVADLISDARSDLPALADVPGRGGVQRRGVLPRPDYGLTGRDIAARIDGDDVGVGGVACGDQQAGSGDECGDRATCGHATIKHGVRR